jgi:signal transduction histidine kinase
MISREQNLRSRLWPRLAGLLLVLTAAVLFLALDMPGLNGPVDRALLAAILLVTGLLLGFSMLGLVRKPSADSHGAIGGREARPDAQHGGQELEEESLKILYDVVVSINTAHSLDDLLTRFLYTFKRITRAHGAAIWVEHDQQQPELSASSGIDEDLLLPDRHDIRRCLYERAATEGKIWVEQNLDKCEKIAGRRLFKQDNIGLVSVPMRYRGKITGVINLFLDADMIKRLESINPLLTSIAYHLGIAIERYHDDDDSRAHLIKEERTRIAHELHDSLAQTIASLRFQVRVLDETLHQGDESTTWQQLERIISVRRSTSAGWWMPSNRWSASSAMKPAFAPFCRKTARPAPFPRTLKPRSCV